MRLLRALLLAMIVIAVPVSSAAEDEVLSVFNSGSYELQFSLRSSVFYGPGATSGSTGGLGSLLFPSPGLAAWNPAATGFVDRPLFSVSVTPPLKAALNSYFDPGRMSRDVVDDAVSDMCDGETDLRYPSVFVEGGQSGGAKSMGVLIPVRGIILGAYMDEPLSLSFSFTGTGLEAVILTEKELAGEKKPLGAKMTGDITASGGIVARSSAVFVSRKLVPWLGIGGSVDFYQARANLLGAASLGGLLSFAGQEYAFNDPTAAWENSLDQNIEADLRANAVGAKVGAAFVWKDWFSFDVCFERAPELALTGPASFTQHIVPAIGGGDGQEVLDPTRLDIARMTETKILHNPMGDSLLVELPSSVRIGVGFRHGWFGGMVGYSKYVGDFRAVYMNRRAGVRINDCVRTGIRVGPSRLGVSLLRLRYYSGRVGDVSLSSPVFLPTASLGIGLRVGSSTTVETQLVGIPGPFFNVTLMRSF